MKFKKLFALAVAGIMTMSFTACGNNSQSADSDTFKIGGIGPLTGDAANYGNSVKNGCQVAVDEINAAGGANGKKLELLFEDDVNDAEKSVNAYNTLMDQGVQAIVGSVTSSPCIAVAAESAMMAFFRLLQVAQQKNVQLVLMHLEFALLTHFRVK